MASESAANPKSSFEYLLAFNRIIVPLQIPVWVIILRMEKFSPCRKNEDFCVAALCSYFLFLPFHNVACLSQAERHACSCRLRGLAQQMRGSTNCKA